MEESVKRRERLKLMRTEAAQTGVNYDAEHSMMSSGLSNPLIETYATQPPQVESGAPQRFDYYTDPMSAFSGNKRKSRASHQISQDYCTPPRPMNTEMTPPPAFQAQTNYSPDHRMYQAQGLCHSSGPRRSPMGLASPLGMQQGTPPGIWNVSGVTSSYCIPSNSPRGVNFPSPGFRQECNFPSPGPHRSPMGLDSPLGMQQGTPPGVWNGSGVTSSYCIPSNSPRGGKFCSPDFGQGGNFPSPGPHRSPMGLASPLGMQQGTPPGVWNGSDVASSYCFPSNSPRGGTFPSPGFGQGGSPSSNSGQGRGHWFSNSLGPVSGRGGSPGPNSGRGRGRWLGSGMSPGSGQFGGRGQDFHNSVSAELRPDRYYKKSMVEDPWRVLKPVIWRSENVPVNSLNTPDSLKSWLPKSLSMKRSRISESSTQPSSQQSLAEYLAASFNEATHNEAGNDERSV